jgi:hypothetical protein
MKKYLVKWKTLGVLDTDNTRGDDIWESETEPTVEEIDNDVSENIINYDYDRMKNLITTINGFTSGCMNWEILSVEPEDDVVPLDLENMTIGEYKVNRTYVLEYINVLNFMGKYKTLHKDAEIWDKKRVELHKRIFDSLRLNRFSDEGKKFSDALNKSIIDNIIDPFTKKLIMISSGVSKEELELQEKKEKFIANWNKKNKREKK